MEKRLNKDILVFVALIGLIVLGRFMPHAANFTPAAAAGLFAGYWFRNRLVAVSVPLIGMLLSDLIIDMPYHLGTMAIVYGAISLPALLAGGWLRKSEGSRWTQALKVLIGAGSGSVLFFVSTNMAVWLFDGMYALNGTGFAACFAAAVPFFKWTLAGDMSFAAIIFGTFMVAQQWVALRNAKVEAA
jgi:hypothetical protein